MTSLKAAAAAAACIGMAIIKIVVWRNNYIAIFEQLLSFFIRKPVHTSLLITTSSNIQGILYLFTVATKFLIHIIHMLYRDQKMELSMNFDDEDFLVDKEKASLSKAEGGYMAKDCSPEASF